MSKIEVNAIEPQCGTTLTVGASGDTIVIPSGATISNQGTAAGFGPTGAVSWNTTKITADPNPAVTGVGYFCDTTSAAFTVTLPSSPSAGAVVGIADYANTFATNNLTVDRNGSNIGGNAFNATLSVNGVSVTFVYVDATQGWIVTDSGQRSNLNTAAYVVATGGCVTTCGDFKIHTFTGPGTFTITSAGNPQGSSAVDYLVVAGGGGGGSDFSQSPTPNRGAGGGGAGGYRTTFPSPGCNAGSFPISVATYPITVGAGGSINTCNPTAGGNGNPSIFSTITSTGGGGGGGHGNPAPGIGIGNAGKPGGSGGGAYSESSGTQFGIGNTPPVSPPQGNSGGNGYEEGPSSTYRGAGGGGALSPSTPAGINASFYGAGTGGTGAASSITGSSVTRGGGGGGSSGVPGCAATGGAGGGGNGAYGAGTGGPGTINTGGGGGSSRTGGTGGSGIVVIRYKYQ